jgi:hypothetical protein
VAKRAKAAATAPPVAPAPEPSDSGFQLRLSPFQEAVMRVPEKFDLMIGGGRGGGKSYTLALLILRAVEQYGSRCRALYLRQSHQGCADFEALCQELYGAIYGRALRFNGQEGLFRFPSGATLEINQLADAADFSKYQGRSFRPLIAFDEVGQYAVPQLIDLMRSNLRGPKDMPTRYVLAGNPGGPGHMWVSHRYIFKAAPWKPFLDETSKREFVYAPSTFLDNPHIDQAEYRKQLESSCPTDPELLRAWLDGDWHVARGAYFAAVLEEKRNAIDPWDAVPVVESPRRGPRKWEHWISYDHGSAAPSVTYLLCRSPGAKGPDGKFYPRDSVIVLDELATNDPQHLNKGLQWTVPRLAEEIKALCARWGVEPEGCCDDAAFAHIGAGAGSIADEFRQQGVSFSEAKKGDRQAGWERMRRLMADAGRPDVPGLFIARSCTYFWQTVPFLARDPRRIEDVDSRGPDHAADALRYGIVYEPQVVTMRTFRELAEMQRRKKVQPFGM